MVWGVFFRFYFHSTTGLDHTLSLHLFNHEYCFFFLSTSIFSYCCWNLCLLARHLSGIRRTGIIKQKIKFVFFFILSYPVFYFLDFGVHSFTTALSATFYCVQFFFTSVSFPRQINYPHKNIAELLWIPGFRHFCSKPKYNSVLVRHINKYFVVNASCDLIVSTIYIIVFISNSKTIAVNLIFVITNSYGGWYESGNTGSLFYTYHQQK